MSSEFRVSERIDCQPEAIWEVLTDWSRAPEWMKGIDHMRVLDSGAVGLGTELAFRSRGAERRTTVTAWSPPKRLALQSQQGGVTATYEYSCEAEGNGSRLTLHARCVTRGFVWKVIGPAIGYLMKRADSGQVNALRVLVESESVIDPDAHPPPEY